MMIRILQKKLMSRRESVMKIQCLVANYLHPVYRGRKLSEDQLNKVEEFLLNELSSDGLNSLQNFLNSEGIFRVFESERRIVITNILESCKKNSQRSVNISFKASCNTSLDYF